MQDDTKPKTGNGRGRGVGAGGAGTSGAAGVAGAARAGAARAGWDGQPVGQPRRFFCTLPMALRGKASTTRISLGRLWTDSTAAT